jgi:hypothetical protein
LFGVVVRVVISRDDTLLGHTAALEGFTNGGLALVLDFLVYEPIGLTARARQELEAVWISLVKELIVRFGARPHWGKNQDWVFEFAIENGAYRDSLPRFVEQLRSLDANGTFSNAFTDRLFRTAA